MIIFFIHQSMHQRIEIMVFIIKSLQHFGREKTNQSLYILKRRSAIRYAYIFGYEIRAGIQFEILSRELAKKRFFCDRYLTSI